jgi:transcriptional regulator GlxA family with amidase domain
MRPAISARTDIHLKRVIFVAVPPIQILDLTGPFEVFARCGGYKVELATSEPGPISSSCGLTLGNAAYFREVSGPVDTLVVPGGCGAEELRCNDDFLNWFRGIARSARRVCSICTGTFVLAHTGLLDGRRAVTHWNWCERLSVQFPKIRVERAPLFVRDGAYYSSGGVTAGMDLALALVEEDHGAARSAKIAQDLVMFLRRGASHSQFSSFLAVHGSASRSIDDLCSWIADHLDADLSVPVLATRCRLSPRHFARVFAKEMGVTPARFVHELRVSVAQAMLESDGATPKHVAALTGFTSADTMRRSMLQSLTTTGFQS